MIPICDIAFQRDALKQLCDSAEKRGYITGPANEYWAEASEYITASVWLHTCNLGLMGSDAEEPYTRNGGRCIRLLCMGEGFRADIDLEDWLAFMSAGCIQRIAA